MHDESGSEVKVGHDQVKENMTLFKPLLVAWSVLDHSFNPLEYHNLASLKLTLKHLCFGYTPAVFLQLFLNMNDRLLLDQLRTYQIKSNP